MRLETLMHRFEVEVIKGDFNIDYNRKLRGLASLTSRSREKYHPRNCNGDASGN